MSLEHHSGMKDKNKGENETRDKNKTRDLTSVLILREGTMLRWCKITFQKK